jgi:mRNA interferase MazF
MSFKRGEVVLAWYPFHTGIGGKRRPCLIVQNDRDNQRLTNTVVAQITTGMGARSESTHLLIEAATTEGQQAGLLHDSLVSCNNLATIEQTRINRVVGSLSPITMLQVERALKIALSLP